MNQIIIFIVLSISVASLADIYSEPEYVDGIPIDDRHRPYIRTRFLQPRVTEKECDPEDLYKPVCDGDCKTLHKCNGNAKPYSKSICPPEVPYCYKDECSITKDPDNENCDKNTGGETTNDYACTIANTFLPDPTNCERYFFCDKTKVATGYECPKNYVYNSKGSNCKRRVSSSDCSVIKCDRKDGKFVPYPADPSLYGLCTLIDKKVVVIMFKCKVPELSMNELKQTCSFQCKGEGGVIDSTAEKCKSYYFCSKLGNKYEWKLQKCPDDYVYDVKKQTCVESADCVDKAEAQTSS